MLIKKELKMKKKVNHSEMKIICPTSYSDIENIVEMLQERESSILVNLKDSNQFLRQTSINSLIYFIIDNQKSYMKIYAKKLFPKVFICWSEETKI